MSGGPAHREATELALRIGHEVGNLLAGMRLQAALPDADAGARISELAGRAGALVALLRPLLRPGRPTTFPVRPLLDDLARSLEDPDDPRLRVSAAGAEGLPPVSFDPEVLRHLVLAELFAALEALEPPGRLDLAARLAGDRVHVELRIPVAPHGSAGRGVARPLAEFLLAAGGGALLVERDGGAERVAFAVPVAPRA